MKSTRDPISGIKAKFQAMSDAKSKNKYRHNQFCILKHKLSESRTATAVSTSMIRSPSGFFHINGFVIYNK